MSVLISKCLISSILPEIFKCVVWLLLVSCLFFSRPASVILWTLRLVLYFVFMFSILFFNLLFILFFLIFSLIFYIIIDSLNCFLVRGCTVVAKILDHHEEISIFTPDRSYCEINQIDCIRLRHSSTNLL